VLDISLTGDVTMDKFRKALADFNFAQQYAKNIDNRKETWEEACERIYDMHKKRLLEMNLRESDLEDLLSVLDSCKSAEIDKRILSSQRARQFGGEGISRKEWRIYNCTTSYCDRIRFFQEAFWLLLCGCGVGFSVQSVHVDKLPSIRSDIKCKVEPFVVEDTIEGWADAVGALISFYFNQRDTYPIFDFSKIREKGSQISIGGLAPGPEPLKMCIERISNLFDTCIVRNRTRLRSIDCFDIVMHISNAVLAGGVRRAACIVLFDAHDTEMATCKTGNWFVDNPQRGRANISAVILPNTSKDTYLKLFKSTKEFGEPGFVISESKQFLYNPCCEIGMVPTLIRDELGNVVEKYTLDILDNQSKYERMGYTYDSGWQACNLTEVNCAKFTTREQALSAVVLASFLGTIQATYIKSDYLGPVSEQILQRESLIGVSLTGMANRKDIAFNAEWQKQAADYAVNANKVYAKLLNIPQASRVTCVKPSGNAAVLLGCASGIHPEHSKRYLRHVQVNETNPVLQAFKQTNPHAVVPSVWSAPGVNDQCVMFPIEVGDDALVKSDLSAKDFLELVKLTQTNWVRNGVGVERVEALHHNVSNTCVVRNDEWEIVQEYIWENRNFLNGISLISASGDYDYDQPPFRSVSDFDSSRDLTRVQESLNTWNQLRLNWNDADYFDVVAEDEIVSNMSVACSGGACEFIANK
jgi:ribonucleoside-triphosphate reductase